MTTNPKQPQTYSLNTNIEIFKDEQGKIHVVFDPTVRVGLTKSEKQALVANTGPAVPIPFQPGQKIQMFVTAPRS